MQAVASHQGTTTAPTGSEGGHALHAAAIADANNLGDLVAQIPGVIRAFSQWDDDGAPKVWVLASQQVQEWALRKQIHSLALVAGGQALRQDAVDITFLDAVPQDGTGSLAWTSLGLQLSGVTTQVNGDGSRETEVRLRRAKSTYTGRARCDRNDSPWAGGARATIAAIGQFWPAGLVTLEEISSTTIGGQAVVAAALQLSSPEGAVGYTVGISTADVGPCTAGALAVLDAFNRRQSF